MALVFWMAIVVALVAAVGVGIASALAAPRLWLAATIAAALFAVFGVAGMAFSGKIAWRVAMAPALESARAIWTLDAARRPFAVAAFFLPLVGLLADAARGGVARRGSWAWAGLFAVAVVGVFAAAAANLAAVFWVWAFLALGWVGVGLAAFGETRGREAAAWRGFWRTLSVFLLGASLFVMSANPRLAARLVILAAALRLAVLLIEPPLSGTEVLPFYLALPAVEGLSVAAAGLCLAAQSPLAPLLNTSWAVGLTVLGLLGAWRWLRASHPESALGGAVTAFGSIGLLAAGMGVQAAAIAWFLLAVFPPFGVGLLRWRSNITLLVAALWILSLISLPFTTTASVFNLLRLRPAVAVWPSLLVLALGVAATARQVAIMPPERPRLESAAERLSILGAVLWLLVFHALTFWREPAFGADLSWLGARIGLSIFALALGLAAAWVVTRQPSGAAPQVAASTLGLGLGARVFWTLYHWFADALAFFSGLLEGEGGVMWALVLLVMLAVLFSR